MEAVIDNAIQTLAERAEETLKPLEAMQFTQAALNLAHTKATLEAARRDRTAGLSTIY